MGRKNKKEKQAKRQKYIKKKQEQNIPTSKKIVIMIEKTFRYVCMVLYVILCMGSFGVLYSFGITPNIIESISEVILAVIELVLFVIFFDTVWPSHESKRDRKRKKRKKSSYASSSSSGFGDYSSNDCSSSSDGGD
ncbi:TPA: hypothetical protein ROY01_003022 [Bacillus toyonensis]|nr:hypothetical protein [Bacillus toyonensis]